MNDEEADDLLSNNDWSKWSDARYLLKLAYSIGYRRGVNSVNQTQLHAINTELLEALKEMLFPYREETTPYEEARDKARAAITKAEGA